MNVFLDLVDALNTCYANWLVTIEWVFLGRAILKFFSNLDFQKWVIFYFYQCINTNFSISKFSSAHFPIAKISVYSHSSTSITLSKTYLTSYELTRVQYTYNQCICIECFLAKIQKHLNC